MGRYRLLVGLVVGVLYAVHQAVALRVAEPARAVLGYVLSLAFLVAVAEFATAALGRRLAPRRAGGVGGMSPAVGVVLVASLLLVLNLFASKAGSSCAVVKSAPRLVPLLGVVGGWLAAIEWLRRRGGTRGAWFVAMAALVLGTRWLVVSVSPFDRLTGDMLPTIGRGLDRLLAGRFPYAGSPPMPYLPGMFLAYLPPKWLGGDLRLSNLALEVATVAVAIRLGPAATTGLLGGRRVAAPAVGQVALPLFLLHPVWAYYGANTQFAPAVLTAALLGRAVVVASPRVQAVALGLAVGTNQMIGGVAPILFASWARRHGPRRAVGLSTLTMAVFGAMIAPFLLWEPGPFVRVAFLGTRGLPLEVLSGRLTLYPLVAGAGPWAGAVLSALVILAASAWAWRARGPEVVVAALAVGLCGLLMLQPVSFAHYYLPVLTLAAVAPVASGLRPGEGGDGTIGMGRGAEAARPVPPPHVLGRDGAAR